MKRLYTITKMRLKLFESSPKLDKAVWSSLVVHLDI